MADRLAVDGGTPVRDRLLPYGRQRIDADDEQAVLAALRSDYLTTGPRVEAFEEAFAASVGARHAVAFCNGTAALHGAAHVARLCSGRRGHHHAADVRRDRQLRAVRRRNTGAGRRQARHVDHRRRGGRKGRDAENPRDSPGGLCRSARRSRRVPRARARTWARRHRRRGSLARRHLSRPCGRHDRRPDDVQPASGQARDDRGGRHGDDERRRPRGAAEALPESRDRRRCADPRRARLMVLRRRRDRA